MDAIDKKILEYLSEKAHASEVAIINETFKGLGISKEEYVHRLQALQGKDLIRYERPSGNGAFVYITETGRDTLKSFGKKFVNYIKSHILQILTLLVAATSLAIAIWKLLGEGIGFLQ